MCVCFPSSCGVRERERTNRNVIRSGLDGKFRNEMPVINLPNDLSLLWRVIKICFDQGCARVGQHLPSKQVIPTRSLIQVTHVVILLLPFGRILSSSSHRVLLLHSRMCVYTWSGAPKRKSL